MHAAHACLVLVAEVHKVLDPAVGTGRGRPSHTKAWAGRLEGQGGVGVQLPVPCHHPQHAQPTEAAGGSTLGLCVCLVGPRARTVGENQLSMRSTPAVDAYLVVGLVPYLEKELSGEVLPVLVHHVLPQGADELAPL